jgi:hypothetical protein
MTTISPSSQAESMRERLDRRGERLHLAGPVVAAACDQLDLALLDPRHQPIAVELGLDDPVAARRHGDERRELRLELDRQRTGDRRRRSGAALASARASAARRGARAPRPGRADGQRRCRAAP